MYETRTQVLTLIIAVVLILLIICVFMLVILSYYNNRKLKNSREKELLKTEFEQTILRTQLEVQEQTMRQISLEIHDNVGQILSLVNLNLKTLKPDDSEKIHTTASLVNKAIDDLRSLSKSLNPESLARMGLVQVIKNEMDQLSKTGQFVTSLDVEGNPELPPGKLIVVYRMVQEALNNIIKHSGATEVRTTISQSAIAIIDNGKGFHQNKESTGLGLQNLVQRAKAIGAEVEITSNQGKGTMITFKLNKIQ